MHRALDVPPAMHGFQSASASQAFTAAKSLSIVTHGPAPGLICSAADDAVRGKSNVRKSMSTEETWRKLVARYSGLRSRRRRIYTKSVEDRELAVGRTSHVVYVRERSEHAAACVLAGRFFFS